MAALTTYCSGVAKIKDRSIEQKLISLVKARLTNFTFLLSISVMGFAMTCPSQVFFLPSSLPIYDYMQSS